MYNKIHLKKKIKKISNNTLIVKGYFLTSTSLIASLLANECTFKKLVSIYAYEIEKNKFFCSQVLLMNSIHFENWSVYFVQVPSSLTLQATIFCGLTNR